MADNILKNEFMWEKKQEKKKLYKNWKLYAIALGITVIGAGTGLGIYYGIANHSEVTKIDLNTINLETTIQGIENMTKEDAFNAFLSANKDIIDLKDNVEAGTFTAPNYTNTGSLEINATPTGKYNGTITVTINAIKQTNLTDLDLNTTISGTENMTEETAFQAFLDLNQEKHSDLKDNVKTDSFTTPTYTTDGSLIINATKDGKYTGTTTVSINAIGQTDLSTINLETTIQGTENMTEETAFQAFLSANKNIADLENNVETGTFTTPKYAEVGWLVINATATGKYTGNVTVTINAIGQQNLDELDLNTTISGTENMTKEDAFQAFLNLNSTITDLKDNVKIGTFTKPSYTNTGSLEVNTIPTGKYTGTTTVTITKLEWTEREQILQRLKNAYLNKDDNAWLDGWINYFKFVNKSIDSITFTLTKEDLINDFKTQSALFIQLRTSVINELTKWDIVQGYNPEAIVLNYSKFNVDTNNKIITGTGDIAFEIYSLDNSKLPFDGNLYFDYNIHYVVN